MRVLCVALLVASATALSPPAAALEELLELRNDPGFPHNVNEALRLDNFTISLLQYSVGSFAAWPPKMVSQFVVPPSVASPLPGMTAGSFVDVTIPLLDETFPSMTSEEVAALQASTAEESYPHGSWLCGTWYEGEDAQASIDALLVGARNPGRVLVPYGPERYTNEGLSVTVFHEMGQHRVEKVRAGDAHAEGATYAVYLGFAATFEVRPGFARYGADAYFNADGEVTHIRRLGKTYYPSQPGWAKHTLTDVTLRECRELGGWCKCWSLCECRVPAKVGFSHARMAFLGTLLAVVTVIDHVAWGHFSLANALVTSNVQELDIHHPLRRLMHPHTFRTASVNLNAVGNFIANLGAMERMTSLSSIGVKQAWDYGVASDQMMRFMTPPQRFAAQGFTASDKVQLPLHEDGLAFYAVVKEHVHNFTSLHFPGDTCGADEGVRKWVARANSVLPNHDLPTGDAITCSNLEDILASFIYTTTAEHTHVGVVNAIIQDPCHAPMAWREGELCGTPRTATLARAFVELTGLGMPLLMDDYTHLFPAEADKQQWRHFQAELQKFQASLLAKNQQRTRPFRSFDLSVVEVSTGI